MKLCFTLLCVGLSSALASPPLVIDLEDGPIKVRVSTKPLVPSHPRPPTFSFLRVRKAKKSVIGAAVPLDENKPALSPCLVLLAAVLDGVAPPSCCFGS